MKFFDTEQAEQRIFSGPTWHLHCRIQRLSNNKAGPLVAFRCRSKSFPVAGNYYRRAMPARTCFQRFRNGKVLALWKSRRSGAQRGASENNFGQRFSVSTPCFWRELGRPSPHPRYQIRRAKRTSDFGSYLGPIDKPFTLANRASAFDQASTTCSLTSMPALLSSLATASCFMRDASNWTRTVRSFSLKRTRWMP